MNYVVVVGCVLGVVGCLVFFVVCLCFGVIGVLLVLWNVLIVEFVDFWQGVIYGIDYFDDVVVFDMVVELLCVVWVDVQVVMVGVGVVLSFY